MNAQTEAEGRLRPGTGRGPYPRPRRERRQHGAPFPSLGGPGWAGVPIPALGEEWLEGLQPI